MLAAVKARSGGSQGFGSQPRYPSEVAGTQVLESLAASQVHISRKLYAESELGLKLRNS